MLFHLLFGICAAAGFFLLRSYTEKKGLVLSWWQWALTALCLLYGVFVLEVIYEFIREGALQAALVNGSLTGLVGVVAAVLLARFVFLKKA